ncbi:LPS-assembly protein LptD [Oxalobacter paraformigenes]|uniref:LPS-assembly protein LptD n=1 Tax=Oxalobacter paraformigenes TaxID=556268 RepID=UPI001E506E47|nr:LPS-assembly protein LptD [Oxalobacter paraformigenes]
MFSLLATFSTTLLAAPTTPGKAKNTPPQHVENPEAPTILQAEQITGRPARDLYLDYEVEIERDQTLITGDHGIFRQEENEAEIIGNVFIQRFGDQYTADRGNLNLDTGEGSLTHPTYKLAANKARGTANRIELTGNDNTDIFKGTYSTCEGNDPDWYLKSSKLHLDNARNVGYATSPVLYFKDVPILASPAMTFPVTSERKSGVLPPTMGMTSKNGLEVIVPYYFNLAPNYDLTIFPNLMARRGLQLGAEARYLGNNYSGTTYVEYLPNDREADRDRYFFSSRHQQAFNNGWSYYWNVKSASDDNYPDDFSSPQNRSELERLLLREGGINKYFGIWKTTLRATNYKVLQDVESPIIRPFDRLPQLMISGGQEDVNGIDWHLYSDLTRFWLSNSELDKMPLQQQSRGNRFIMKPEISYPIYRGGYFFTPKAILNVAKYDLEESPYDVTSLTRVLPTFSLDGGLIFERDASFFGESMIQTLEPRLFYVYTPYKDQSEYPIFDSGEPSFGYALLFTENRFDGYDRIADANNLTAAVTTRFIEKDGAERMRFTIGQRYYFSDQRVYLYNTNRDESKNRSDLLLMANGKIIPTVSIDTSLQYNQSTQKVYSANFSTQWKPGRMKLLNAEYRYLRDTVDFYGNELDQINVSGQWPIAQRWYAVGQISYSLPENRTIENIFGFEYNADCWIFRLMAQRYATSSIESNTAFYFQLELKGLSKLGTNPLNALQRSIPGYEPLSP